MGDAESTHSMLGYMHILSLSVVPRIRKIWVGWAWIQKLYAFIIAHSLTVISVWTESINYQSVSCLQHVYICTAYWERGKLLSEASCIRTDRGSIGKCCGQLYLWFVVMAGGNSKLQWFSPDSSQPPLGCCGHCTHCALSLRETEMAWWVTSRKLPELKHISKCL